MAAASSWEWNVNGMHKKFMRFLSIQIIRKVGVTMHSNCNQMNQHCICCWQATADKLLRSGVRECAFLSACLWMLLGSRMGTTGPRYWRHREGGVYRSYGNEYGWWWMKLREQTRVHIHYTRTRARKKLGKRCRLRSCRFITVKQFAYTILKKLAIEVA